MPTKLPQAEGNETHVSVHEGSERVVQVKRLSRRTSETVTDQYTNAENTREFLRDEAYATDPSRREVQPRKGTQIGASLFQEAGRNKRVTSILEVNAPQVSSAQSNANRTTATVVHRQSDPDVTEVVESEDETRIIDSFQSEMKSYKKVKTRKHTKERNDLEHSRIRYSNIFVPELSRKYKSKRVPWRHRTSGQSARASNAESVCTQHLCRNCHSTQSLTELKSPCRDRNAYPQSEFTCSMENLHQHRHHHHHHGNQRQSLVSGRYHDPADHRRFLYSYNIDNLPRRMYSSDAIHDLYASNTILSRNADLLEIEYEEAITARDEESESFLTPEKLKIITKLASECISAEGNDLNKGAKTMKLALDERFGQKWHVIVGNDTYGSNVATLPGALVNFKVGKNVILAWQT